MALDKILKIYDSDGNEVDYDILANDVKFQDGVDLPSKIAEMEEDISEAGTGNYTKPADGIPATDLDASVNESLDKADTAFQKPASGIPKSDLAQGVQDSLDAADSAYQKPASGIPATDLADGVIPDVSGLATKTEVNTALGDKVDKETGKGLSTEDYTTDEKTKLGALPTNSELTTALGGKADKSTTYTKSEVDSLIENVEAGDTVVTSLADVAIIDDNFTSPTVLAAPSAREMREIYLNLKALYDNLAGIAFVGTRPNWQTVAKTPYTLTKGTMSDIDSVVIGNDELVTTASITEGEVTVKLTPATGYAIANEDITVTSGGNSVPFSTVENSGVTEVTFVMRGDTTIGAVARNGIQFAFSGTNVSIVSGATSGGTIPVETAREIILSHPEHYSWGTITVTYGTTDITSSCTITDLADGTKKVTLPNNLSDRTKTLTITASATENAKITVTLPNDEHLIVKHGNDTISTSTYDVYTDMLDCILTFEPASGYRFSTAPSASGGGTMTGSGRLYTLTIGSSDTSDITVSAATEVAPVHSVTIPSGTGITVEDEQGNTLTGAQSVTEGDSFTCIVRCTNGYGFASNGTPSGGTSSTQQTDGSYKVIISAVNADTTISATAEAITTFTAGGLNYNVLTNTSNAGVTVKSGSTSSPNTGDKYTGAITVPASVSYHGASYNVTEIGSSAFRNCSGVTSVTLPEGLTKINANAFQSCSGLQSCNMPTTLTSIGGWAFQEVDLRSLEFRNTGTLTIGGGPNSVFNNGTKNCSSLQFNGTGSVTTGSSSWTWQNLAASLSSAIDVFIPGNVSIYGANFYGAKIKKLEFGEGTTSINDEFGMGMSDLRTIILPSTITNVGYKNFPNTVTKLVCKAVNPPTINTNNNPSFANYNMDIYVPDVAVADYQAQGGGTSGWSKYANIHPMSEYTES